jgi:hypothetical protein
MLVIPPHVEQPQVWDTALKWQDLIAVARPNLCDAESRELEELLTEYGDIFVMDSGEHGRADSVQHRIDTGEARQFRQRPGRLPLTKQTDVGNSAYLEVRLWRED